MALWRLTRIQLMNNDRLQITKPSKWMGFESGFKSGLDAADRVSYGDKR